MSKISTCAVASFGSLSVIVAKLSHQKTAPKYRTVGPASPPSPREGNFNRIHYARVGKAQIVILSCREALFQGLGAKRLGIEEL